MKTTEIIKAIDEGFTKKYRNAVPFVHSELWNFCIDTIKNPVLISNIVFANDMGIPPVKSLITIYERKHTLDDSFSFADHESQYMGALMGYVFKFVLGYKSQKERCKVNHLGVGTATRFLDGPAWEFEGEE